MSSVCGQTCPSLPAVRPQQYDTVTHWYLTKRALLCFSLQHHQHAATFFLLSCCCDLSSSVCKARHCSFLPLLSLSCRPSLSSALHSLTLHSFFLLWNWHGLTFRCFFLSLYLLRCPVFVHLLFPLPRPLSLISLCSLVSLFVFFFSLPLCVALFLSCSLLWPLRPPGSVLWPLPRWPRLPLPLLPALPSRPPLLPLLPPPPPVLHSAQWDNPYYSQPFLLFNRLPHMFFL